MLAEGATQASKGEKQPIVYPAVMPVNDNNYQPGTMTLRVQY